MNILVICNDKNKLVFNQSVSQQSPCGLRISFSNEKKESNTRTHVEFFNPKQTDKQKYSLIKIARTYLRSGDYNENQVFIVPEDVDTGSIDKGYDLACELLGIGKPFNLRFVSMFKREQLIGLVKSENRILVETFPHLYLFDKAVEIPTSAYSPMHFRLISDVAISKSGRLDFIRHDVRNIITKIEINPNTLEEAMEKAQRHTRTILNALDINPYNRSFPGFQASMDSLLKQADEITNQKTVEEFNAYLHRLQNDIRNFIDEVDYHLKGKTTTPHSPTGNGKKNYRVLIIEDNLDHRKMLYSFFSNYYKLVVCNDLQDTLGAESEDYSQWTKSLNAVFSENEGNIEKEMFKTAAEKLTLRDPDKALQWLKTKENVDRFDLVILDLLFKNSKDGTWLPFNGLDLFKLINTNNSFCTVRVITSLPRNQVSAILGKEKLVLPMNKVFTKSKGWEELPDSLYYRMDEMDDECDDNARARDMASKLPKPVKGFFSETAVKRKLVEMFSNGEFDQCFQEASDYLDSVEEDSNKGEFIHLLKNRSKANKAPNYTPEIVKNYLIHRLAFIRWAAHKYPSQMKGIITNDYPITLQGLKIKSQKANTSCVVDYSYLNKLGFEVDQKFGLKVNLNPSTMFREELKTYIQISKQKDTSTVDDNVKPWLQILRHECSQVDCDDTIFKDTEQAINITYKTLKAFFKRCTDLLEGTKTKKSEKRQIKNLLDHLFDKKIFDGWGLEDVYDEVLDDLKQHGITPLDETDY